MKCQSLELFGTLGCHLCEQAKQLIEAELVNHAYILREVDISESDELMTLYAVRIPVLYRPDCQLELGWPFDSLLLNEFLLV